MPRVKYPQLQDATWLREAYLDRGLTMSEIAAEIGGTFGGVRDALVRQGIPIRRKGLRDVPWPDRFWRYLTPGAPDECWEWNGSRDAHGYGRLNSGSSGQLIKAHRASYEIHCGPVPEGLLVCHRCDNPPCCNPAHLFVGTHVDNGQDMAAKGRHGTKPGEGHHCTRLSDADIRSVRERCAAGDLHRLIAPDFGISVGYVSLLALGQVRPEAGGPFTRRQRRAASNLGPAVAERLRSALSTPAASAAFSRGRRWVGGGS